MRDVNGSSFFLLADPADWSFTRGMAWDGGAMTLLGRPNWRLPTADRATARAALAASMPVVIDTHGGVARLAADGSGVEVQEGAAWVRLNDLNGTALAPKTGKFIAMALGGARLALLASDGTNSFLELFDLRGRWALDSPENPALPVVPDPMGAAIAVAPDGPIFVVRAADVAMFEGGPIEQFIERDTTKFQPTAQNPTPLRQTATLPRPGGAPVALSADATRIALLCDQGSEPQTLAVLDRDTGAWTSVPVQARHGGKLPYITDVALLDAPLIALMAPIAPGDTLRDCAVATLSPPDGLTLDGSRYPMLDQSAPRFAAIPGPDVHYLGAAGPRRLLPLPHPGYLTEGVVGRFGLEADDPDTVWHRLYAEADLPPGTSLAVWARAAETSVLAGGATAASVLSVLSEIAPGTTIADAAAVPAGNPLAAPLAEAPFHLQPPLVASPLASELPYHPGLAALSGMPGGLYELLLQRRAGANRRLQGMVLDLVVVATGDGRHSPCLRAARIYGPRFSYQDQYLPALFHQTDTSDEADRSPAVSPPDFRERLLAALEGILTPIEGRVAKAEWLLDPYVAPAAMLPWLGSYLGRDVDPGWPEARRRRAIAEAGRLLQMRGTYRGVCLALDIATDGAVARGEIVLLETHRLRRTDATILGIAMSGRNILTEYGVPSGNSIVGDTLVLSPRRAIDILALLAPSVARGAEAAQASQFLDEYADRIQVAAILHGPAAALVPTVRTVLTAELPAHLRFEVIVSERSFILGLGPLLGIDTFLDPPEAPAPLILNQSVLGRDAVVHDPAALRP